jgi:Smg protein
MFEVLAFVYENYWQGDACLELIQLERKLSAVGFDAQEIQDALTWLDQLNLAAHGLQQRPPLGDHDHMPPPSITLLAQSPDSLRIYTNTELNHLGVSCIGFVIFLETSGLLTAHLREIVIDRAMATPPFSLPLDDLKIIILMVFWSLGEQPGALLLDELCGDIANRVAH